MIISFGQISEGRSGVVKVNISRKGSNQNTSPSVNEGLKDFKAPVINLQNPFLPADSLIISYTPTLLIKGKVDDESGIFSVKVNGIDAAVSPEGIFWAEIDLAIGKNKISITTTDINQNTKTLQFYSERFSSNIADSANKNQSLKNSYDIEILNPAYSGYITSNNKIFLQACIKASQPIEKIMLFRNDSFINGFLSTQIIPGGNCSFYINEPVTLKLGINDIKIKVYTNAEMKQKSITIEYSFYAARNFALLIGNEKYDDPGIFELTEPVRDATELFKTLTESYTFNQENITFLKNPTKAEIIGTLHQIRTKVTPSDNLLIFYAGHGYWDEGMGVGYWLPKDAQKDNPVNWIPNTDLTNYIGAIKSKHTLLIADACFSGGIFKTRSAFNTTNAVEMLYQLNSRKAITSGTLTEVPDRSIFFQYLLKNLKENTNIYLPAEELFLKMRMAVISNSQNVPQFGTIQNVGDEGGDFIFIRRKSNLP